MRTLLDTNIIIHREASRVINEDIGLLFNWLDKLHIDKCVHPLSIEEVSGHKDPEIVKTMKIKMGNYNLLQTESPECEQIKDIRKNDVTRNDFIDTSILKEVFNNRVNYLITEDRGIHKKAILLGISEKIFTIDAFLEKVIAENPSLKEYTVLSVKKEFFGNLNLSDTFFDSFKEDYFEFQEWFNSKSDKSSYVCVTNDKVRAFLYLKVENNNEVYNDIFPQLPAKKRLKIGTFKVTSTGYKLGERFLKIIYDNAISFGVEEIYVTIFDKRDDQQRLIKLLEDWGFKHWSVKETKNGQEQVYIRDFNFLANIVQPKVTYPFVSRQTTKYIVPIYPQYHTELFPDSILNNESPQDFIENEPHRNAIQKVYISRSYKRNLNTGDIIIFYRTGGHYKGVVSTLAVVESTVKNIRDEEHFIELCRKRSVFDNEELKKHWNYNKSNRPFIVNFLYIDSFPTPKVNLKRLRELDIIQDAPRGFEPLESSKFEEILKEARANGNYIVD